MLTDSDRAVGGEAYDESWVGCIWPHCAMSCRWTTVARRRYGGLHKNVRLGVHTLDVNGLRVSV
eukprot:SAG11_NODE_2478_length_3312_cov_24.075008_4_plen_64_part_00